MSLDRIVERRRVTLVGIVQGVGFRPFVFRLAKRHCLSGYVLNDVRGVMLEVQGACGDLDAFMRDIRGQTPRAARIERIDEAQIDIVPDESDFTIRSSMRGANENRFISPDLCLCDDCRREILDPQNRRYQYPFTNCTHCGPRFSIIQAIPYDRPYTTMASFKMCARCRKEYENPLDRRFHAQPVCCPECGPQLSLYGAHGRENDASFAHVQALLLAGNILAVKGLGGFHIICDAQNEQAVRQLRIRKHRDKKPFALMARDIDTVRRFCDVSATEENLLRSAAAPIVLLAKKQPELDWVSTTRTLGIMLPYTPLHCLLFSDKLPLLVATSANNSGEAIVHTNQAALDTLFDIVDYVLLHDRDIFVAIEDSIAVARGPRETVLRRGRGYTPLPLDLSFLELSCGSVLAYGGELKNTFCLTKRESAFLSGHLGDLNHLSVAERLTCGIEHFRALYDITPEIVAYDMHPSYISTQLALCRTDARFVPVQHHHAHIAACMAENRLNEQVIGVAFDGTGFGDDGANWGGEFFLCDYMGYDRRFHLQYAPMPGGDRCAIDTVRMKNAYLYMYGMFTPRGSKEELLFAQLEKRVFCPMTSSVGRLFDAVAALLGICAENTYEAEAAIALQECCDLHETGVYHYTIEGGSVCLRGMFDDIIGDMRMGIATNRIAMRFHRTLAYIVADVCALIRLQCGANKVCLSGGVFQNLLLLSLCEEMLVSRGFCVYCHGQIPANDGGISLGQAVIAYVKEAK